tara:strand:- start:7282 stop:7857 length:576 start_codon:yes stop_codon:yes gene_type:complete
MGFMAESQATKDRNNAKRENWIRQNKEYDVTANLDDVKYLNDISENKIQNDLVYQAMLNQWQVDDQQLDKIFREQDHKIEDAIIEMHANDYAGTQTGATAARLAAAPVREMGMMKSRALHEKMFAVKETKLKKEITWHEKSTKSWNNFMDQVAFAPAHAFRPAPPIYERGPSPAGMILGVAGSIAGGMGDD